MVNALGVDDRRGEHQRHIGGAKGTVKPIIWLRKASGMETLPLGRGAGPLHQCKWLKVFATRRKSKYFLYVRLNTIT